MKLLCQTKVSAQAQGLGLSHVLETVIGIKAPSIHMLCDGSQAVAPITRLAVLMQSEGQECQGESGEAGAWE